MNFIINIKTKDIIEEVHESSEISNLDAILFRLPNMMNRKFVDDV